MDYTSYHRRNVLKFEPWQIKRVEKGMILDAWYTNDDGQTNRHYILVLNPRYRYPGEKEWKLHAIKLNKFPLKALNLLAETYGITWTRNIQRYRKMDVTKLVQQISSQRFYRQEVKFTMKKFPSYRTYKLDNFTKVFVCDYKFPDAIEKRYLGNLSTVEPTTEKRHNLND